MSGGPNYFIPAHAPLDGRRGVHPIDPRATGKPTDLRGTGRPVPPEGTGGPNYAIPTGTPPVLGPAAAAYILGRGERRVYISKRKGPTAIERMDPLWRARAARAVIEGRRPQNPPSVVRSLLRGLNAKLRAMARG